MNGASAAVSSCTSDRDRDGRPAVFTRKVCGGNRTARGADMDGVLASALRTIQPRKLDAAEVLSKLLRSPEPITVLAPPTT